MGKLSQKVALPLSRGLLRMRMPKLALKILAVAVRHKVKPPTVALLQLQAHQALGNKHEVKVYTAKRLRALLVPHISSKNYVQVIMKMAELERTERAAQFDAGRIITELLVSEKGRATLLNAAIKARVKFPDSIFMLHLITICQSMQGNYREASKLLTNAVPLPSNEDESGTLKKRRAVIHAQSWRVVDLLAREQMDWADDVRDTLPVFPSKAVQSEAPGVPEVEEIATHEEPPLSAKEKALQMRQRDDYLNICDKELNAATTPLARIEAMANMMKTGIRHIPDYTPSYARARRRLREHENFLEELFLPDKVNSLTEAEQTVLELCSYLKLTHQLDRSDLTDRIAAYLEELSTRPNLAHALWPAPAALAHIRKNEEAADRVMEVVARNQPRINRDMQHYFKWAGLTRNYQAANAFYAALPKGLRRRKGLLYYVNILQRQGRFGHALRLLKEVHSLSLTNPSRIDAWSNHSLIKRYGELQFLIETDKIYKSVPQPKNPKGIILVAPRNIDQLRRYPLMALLEFKRRGWAVLPMVEGLLPREQTGNKKIDVINCAISPVTALVPRAEAVIPQVKNFKPELNFGRLTWGPIDLGHSIWEDSTINRRRYSINYECPEMRRYLGGLADWTHSMARVLNYTRKLHKSEGIRVGLVSLFNYRLPDSLFRFYCERYGHPEKFFYLHTANGYQNYFTNFSTNISQRLVMRNMTRSPHVRSGSFPLPENFERYYKMRQDQLPEIVERFLPITKVRRSTEASDDRTLEAQELDARIAEWRKQGGKVACAFGKVVCDNGVPYDGGAGHANMKDWINHSIRSVQGSDTMLLIKPHPHELNNQIATFPTEYFKDLIEEPLGENTIFMGHHWFDMEDMRHRIDLGLVYNGTTTIELGLMGIPCITASHFAHVDYPIGQLKVESRSQYELLLNGSKNVVPAPDLRERAAVWLDYMANDNFTQPYRFHARPVTNKVVYPPYWFKEDLKAHGIKQNRAIAELVGRALGERFEPGHKKSDNALDMAGSTNNAFTKKSK